MNTITSRKMFALLSGLRGAQIIAFTAVTDARLKKNSTEFGRHQFGMVWKRNRITGMVNFHYDAGVLRRLEKEGKSPKIFERGESWHEPVMHEGKLTPFCKHKGNGDFYLRIMHLSNVGEPTYLSDIGELTKEQVQPWLPAESRYENQGLDEPLRFLVYKLEGIQELTLSGTDYLIKQAA